MRGCFTKLVKGVAIFFGLVIALGVIGAIMNPGSSTRTARTSTTEVDSVAMLDAKGTPLPTNTPLPTPTPTLTVDELKTIAVDIDYKDLYRNIETHVGKVLHATGQIVQTAKQKTVVIFGDDVEYTIFRVNMTKNEAGFYSDTIWIEYHGAERFLEDDIIEFWATVEGLQEYETIMGGQVELPRLTINAISLIEE